jgi:Tol biopolymer transport system component
MSSSRAPGTGSDDIWEGPAMGQAPSRVNELSVDGFADNGVFVSPDCRTLYFASNRSGTTRIYVTQRATSNGAWDPPQLLPDFMNVGTNQSDPFIAGDLRTFVFASNSGAATGTDMYITTR